MIIQIKVNKPIMGFDKGVYKIEADNEGTPIDVHWNRRLKDAKIDNCCEVIKEQKLVLPVKKDKEKE